LSATTVRATPVHVIKSFKWSPPNPDPNGLSYNKATDKLLVSDSEVDEIRSLWQGVNLFVAFRGGRLAHTRTLIPTTHEPEDIAFDNRAHVLYIVDDEKDSVFRFRPGKDGKIATRDDRPAEVLNTHRFRSHDPEGLAYDSADGSLLIADQRRARIYHVRRGKDQTFGTADDRVRKFRTKAFGLRSPEDVEFNPANRHLLIVSSKDHYIAETTVSGTLVRLINIASANIENASGITLAPATGAAGRTDIYIADRGQDNEADPRENDGRIVELAVP
jgi:uncharacterized protein YjiK